MSNTLQNGDIVLVWKPAEIQRGDIVQFCIDERDGSYIKRVVGLSNESLNCSDGTLKIDGIVIDEDYTTSDTDDFSAKVAEDEYFLMGDNRSESYDSRMSEIGGIRKNEIIGKVICIIYPLDRIGTLKARPNEEVTRTESEEDSMWKKKAKEETKVLTRKEYILKEIKEWAVSLLVALLVVFILRSTLFTLIRVDGSSMYDTLLDGERLFVTVFDVKWGTVDRGEVVICKYPNRGWTNFVKRVVAVPGDTVYRKDGVTHVLYSAETEKGTAIYDEAIDEGNTIYRYEPDYDKYVLGENQYFVVGDNRNNSHDSRDWMDNDPSRDVGPITKDMLVGHVREVIWPLSSIREVK